MSVWRLAFKGVSTVGTLDTFSVNDDGRADFDLDVLFFFNAINSDLKVEFAHTCKKSFTGLLVGRDLQGSVGLGERAKSVDELGQVLHALGLDGDGDHRVRVVSNGFKGREFLVSGEGYTSCSRANTGYSGDVSCHDFGDGDSVSTNHHSDLLDTFWLCSTDSVHGLTLVDCTGVNTANRHFTSMRVHPNLGDHHGKFSLGVTVHHGLTDFRFQIARPNVRDTVLLGLNWAGKFGDRHVKKNFVNGCLLSKRLLVFVVAVFEDFLEGNAGLGHVGDGNSPVVVG